MYRGEYRGCRVEIFTEKKGKRWTWSFVVNGTEAKHNTEEMCPTQSAARDEAYDAARSFIDREM
jgi:hypothetical protein